MNTETKAPFQFKQIEGMMSLEQATKELVHIAECMQRSHTLDSAKGDALMLKIAFDVRKKGINSLMDLIEQYVNQMQK